MYAQTYKPTYLQVTMVNAEKIATAFGSGYHYKL
jgi:hypothetical protein